ncbi:MAG TPA: glycosyltransferase family 1 protein [Candidatus Portnoybacteria bacterium]|nr:glycosyltransferase family 1 protein [Candidatus Portnoybacteria bacterium]
MIIGINATAAIKQPRTGVEEYTYQLIKHLTMLPEAGEHRFLLYLPAEALAKAGLPVFDFPLPPNFEIKILRWPLPFLWTQARLAWEMLFRPPEALFIPVHILPFGAPKKSIVAIHGLEYEYFPEYYSWLRKLYLRWSTKRAAGRARNIIAISENTKNDLVKLYGCAKEKIKVVHHGIGFKTKSKADTVIGPYVLYLGRLETKKNVQGILAAYKIFKEEYGMPHELILAGSPGYGYESLKPQIKSLPGAKELGYVDEDEKWQLLAGAAIFLYPSFYEGFGLPLLEAQAAGAPVITSFGSCLPEIAGEGALFINPQNPAQIAEAVKQIIDDKPLRDKLRQSGFENVKRFSWEECARETLKSIISG